MKPATVEEIRVLCRAIGLPDQSHELVAAGLTVAEVKATLFDLYMLLAQARRQAQGQENSEGSWRYSLTTGARRRGFRLATAF